MVTLAFLAPRAWGQHAEYMDPDKSAAKAKEILQQMIAGLGGQRFLQMKTSMCEGRRAQFGHNGETSGFIQAKTYWNYPDKLRVDFGKKGNIVDLFLGDTGWTLDRGGVSEEPATSVSDFQAALLRNVDYLLRVRLNEQGLLLRYGGNGIAELREVEWVEVTDSEDRTMKIAMDKSSHLPIRTVVTSPDLETRERHEDVTIYSNYLEKDGVQLPMQISRQHDGRRQAQTFYESCEVNPNLPGDYFTKEGLEKRYAEVGGKKKK
jgi:hypothetical protein